MWCLLLFCLLFGWVGGIDVRVFSGVLGGAWGALPYSLGYGKG